MEDAKFITEYLNQYYDELTPREFYRGLFPEGELEKDGEEVRGKYKGVICEFEDLSDPKKPKINKYNVADDLNVIDKVVNRGHFSIMSPVSYAGKSRKSENARFLYALAIDLDAVGDMQHLTDLFHQIKVAERIPVPTYMVASGTGLHLYYQFVKPIPCFENINKQMEQMKHALVRRIWNKFVTHQYENPQYQSLFQGFRLVGSPTKQGGMVRAFLTGKPVTVEYLNQFVPDRAQVTEFAYKSNLTLSQAKEKYPEWYEKRIVKKQGANHWTCKRDLYDWWLRRIKTEATEHHRYFSVMCLAIYARKCGIEESELIRDAYSLIDNFDCLTTEENNHFTEYDVAKALESYNDGFCTFPIKTITKITDIPIEKNRRNFQKQEWHLEEARHHKALMKRRGQEFKNREGRPNKELEVKMWCANHPEGKKADCIRDLKIDRKTASKYWINKKP